MGRLGRLQALPRGCCSLHETVGRHHATMRTRHLHLPQRISCLSCQANTCRRFERPDASLVVTHGKIGRRAWVGGYSSREAQKRQQCTAISSQQGDRVSHKEASSALSSDLKTEVLGRCQKAGGSGTQRLESNKPTGNRAGASHLPPFWLARVAARSLPAMHLSPRCAGGRSAAHPGMAGRTAGRGFISLQGQLSCCIEEPASRSLSSVLQAQHWATGSGCGSLLRFAS